MAREKDSPAKKKLKGMKYKPPFRHAYLAPMLQMMNYETHPTAQPLGPPKDRKGDTGWLTPPRQKTPIPRRRGGNPIRRNEPIEGFHAGTGKGNLDKYAPSREDNWSATNYGSEGRRGTKPGTKMAKHYASQTAADFRARKHREHLDREERERAADPPIPPKVKKRLKEEFLKKEERKNKQRKEMGNDEIPVRRPRGNEWRLEGFERWKQRWDQQNPKVRGEDPEDRRLRLWLDRRDFEYEEKHRKHEEKHPGIGFG